MKLTRRDLLKLEKRHWDEKLSRSKCNPWPLAPRDLVRMGLVNYDNYLKENGALTVFCTKHMSHELETIAQDIDPKALSRLLVEVLGPGLGNRDLRWLGIAFERGFSFNARDISSVAMKNIRLIFPQFIVERRMNLVIGDIEHTLEKKKVNPKRTVVYFASQFFQVLDRGKMLRTLGELGLILNQWPSDAKIKPRIYVIHPIPEDNSGPKRWNGIYLPGVEWGDTTAYSKDELCKALECRLHGRRAVIKVIGKHRYFHQCYSLIRISLES